MYVKGSRVDTSGTIYSKSSMLLAYADDIDVVGRTSRQVKDTFAALKGSAARIGLSVNVSKTKFMVATSSESSAFTAPTIQLGGDSYEVVDNFVYLGSQVNRDNNVQEEVRRRIAAGNRCYYGLHKLFKSMTLSRHLKCTLPYIRHS